MYLEDEMSIDGEVESDENKEMNMREENDEVETREKEFEQDKPIESEPVLRRSTRTHKQP